MKEASIGIVFNETGNEILLIKRRDVPIWVLPGGGIEENETSEEAVVREMYEETALRVRVIRKTGLYVPVNRLASCAHVFECQIIGEKSDLIPQSESREIAFFPVDSLPKITFFVHQEWIEDARKNLKDPIISPMYSLTWTRAFKELFLHPILLIRYLFSRIGLPINT